MRSGDIGTGPGATLDAARGVRAGGSSVFAQLFSQILAASPVAFGPWIAALVLGALGLQIAVPGMIALEIGFLALMLLDCLPSVDATGHLDLGCVPTAIAAIVVTLVSLVDPARTDDFTYTICGVVVLGVLGLILAGAFGWIRPEPGDNLVLGACVALGACVGIGGSSARSSGQRSVGSVLWDPDLAYVVIPACVVAFFVAISFLVWYSVLGTVQAFRSMRRWPGVWRWGATLLGHARTFGSATGR